MTKRTFLFAVALVALAWWLLRRPGNVRYSNAAPPENVAGLPVVRWVVPPMSTEPGGIVAPGTLFDWFNGDQCGCEGESPDIVIDTVILGERPRAGWVYVQPLPPLPPALKLAPSDVPVPRSPTITPMERNPPPVPATPPPPVVWNTTPEVPSFWWDWQGFTRVLKTSDGYVLGTGLKKRKFKVIAGPGLLDEITEIEYLGNRYVINRSRSVGL